MTFGVTPTGFVRKRFEDILSDLNIGVSGVFPGVDLNPESPDGQFNGLFANELSRIWEIMEDVYHSFDPFQVEGARLDAIMASYRYPTRLIGESDKDYRERIFGTFAYDPTVPTSINGTVISYNLRDDLELKLSSIPGVTYAYVISNDKNSTDPVTTLPPHSFAAIIEGGDDETIARTIWYTWPPGITTLGNTTVQIEDDTQKCRDVIFERPVNVPISAEYVIKISRSQCGCGLPSADAIAEAIIANIAADECGYQAGANILISKMFGYAAVLPGVEVGSVEISRDLDPVAPDNIQLAFGERPTFDASNITITIVAILP